MEMKNVKALNYAWRPGGLLNAVADNDANATVYQYDPVGRLSGLKRSIGSDSIDI